MKPVPQPRPARVRRTQAVSSREIIFEIREDEVDGGYVATALGYGIHTQAESTDELKRNIRDAIDCHFDDPIERPHVIHLHFVKDEVLAL